MSADGPREAGGAASRPHATGTGGPKPDSSGPPTGGPRGALARGLLVSLATLLLLILGAEILLRVTDDREESFAAGVNRTNRRWVTLLQARVFGEIGDPVRRYAMRPGASAEVDGWNFRVSSHRTRGEDFPLEKPADERRILCLGDSFAFGLWSDEDETLVGHLARMANEAEERAGSGLTWRALNLGVPGYHSEQQLVAFEQDGLRLDPDVVVLYYNTNDIATEGHFLDEELGALRADHLPLPVGLRRRLWDWSHLYGWMVRHHTRHHASKPSPATNPDVPWAFTREENIAHTEEALRGIARLCRENDLPLFVVDQPLFTWSGETRQADWEILPLVEWAGDLFAELGVPSISLLGLFRNYPDGVDRFPEPPDPTFLVERYIADEMVQAYFAGEGYEQPQEPDFHLTGAGYGHIARLAYPRLVEAGLLP